MLLIGPREPFFGKFLKQVKEYHDGEGDPLDRWSERILKSIAKNNNLRLIFLLIKIKIGHFILGHLNVMRLIPLPLKCLFTIKKDFSLSFQGSTRLKLQSSVSYETHSVCTDCSKPCENSCPVDALNSNGYNSKKCIEYISSSEKQGMLIWLPRKKIVSLRI